MKKFVFGAVVFALVAMLMVSCASTKYGCPGNPQSTAKFRG